MQLKRHSNQTVLTFEDAQKLGSGGEGVIYSVGRDKRLAAKVYHKPTIESEQKLLAMFRNPPEDPMQSQGHASIAWPVDLLSTTGEKSRIVGFLMPRVPDMFSVSDLFVPKSRLEKCPLFTYQYLHRAGRNIAAAVAPLHARGYVVGDINESNILVSTSALISMVDTDSFQVRETGGRVFRCGVGKAEFTPPELQGKNLRDSDRSPVHDLFGLAVLIYQLLMEGTHPFAGQYRGTGDPPSITSRIQSGHFPNGSSSGQYSPPAIAPPFDILDPQIRELLLKCFETGHQEPSKRPTATVWHETLDRAEGRLKSCRRNAQHRYGTHLKSCPWCARSESLGGRDYFPSRRAIKNGIHLAPPAPKQTPLPALQATASAQSSPALASARKPRSRRKSKSRAASTWGLKWTAWIRSHPVMHTGLCTVTGGVGLGGIRYALGLLVTPMHGWLASVSLASRHGGVGLLAASLVLGALTSAGVWFTFRPAAP